MEAAISSPQGSPGRRIPQTSHFVATRPTAFLIRVSALRGSSPRTSPETTIPLRRSRWSRAVGRKRSWWPGRPSRSMFGDPDFALVRYNANGTLDTSFGKKGKVTTELGGDDYAFGVLEREGKIYAVGRSELTPGGTDYFTVVRYTSTGALDTTFGSGGVMRLGYGAANGVTVDSVGRILVVGTGPSSGGVRASCWLGLMSMAAWIHLLRRRCPIKQDRSMPRVGPITTYGQDDIFVGGYAGGRLAILKYTPELKLRRGLR